MRKHAHASGVWGHAPQELKLGALRLLLRHIIFVLKFILGIDAARILGLSVVGALLAMLHGSLSLVVTCRGYQCQMWALQSIGAKQQKFEAEVN